MSQYQKPNYLALLPKTQLAWKAFKMKSSLGLQTVRTIPRASTLDRVREWPHIFDLLFLGFSSERFWAKIKTLNISHCGIVNPPNKNNYISIYSTCVHIKRYVVRDPTCMLMMRCRSPLLSAWAPSRRCSLWTRRFSSDRSSWQLFSSGTHRTTWIPPPCQQAMRN